jgi:hypothetical protein
MNKLGSTVSLLLAVLAAPALNAQSPRRIARRAFEPAAFVGASLSFNGTRATQPGGFTHDLGSGPMLSVGLEAPLVGDFGIGLNGGIGSFNRVRCEQGANCLTPPDRVLSLRANASILFRFKARAPIFFGAGAAIHRVDPGVVSPVQNDLTLTEFGGVFIIGYDFSIGSKVGGRISWSNYFMVPKEDALGTDYSVPWAAYDALITFGARIKLLQ